jgi:hypothetical protein
MSSLGGQHSRSASTVGGNPINCFKLAPRKKGAFLENGLVAPTFTGAQEDRCSTLPPRQKRLHTGALPTQFNQGQGRIRQCLLHRAANARQSYNGRPHSRNQQQLASQWRYSSYMSHWWSLVFRD